MQKKNAFIWSVISKVTFSTQNYTNYVMHTKG